MEPVSTARVDYRLVSQTPSADPGDPTDSHADDASSPVVVLVRPQLGENIGTVARAMLNCGLQDLRLVAPRHGWPQARAYPPASGADVVLDQATVFPDVASAVADLGHIYACTARLRDMEKPTVTPREAAIEMRSEGSDRRSGLLFGPERNGLDNDEVVPALKIIHVPLNPTFASLNLAQAVLVCAYEWRMAGDASVPARVPRTSLEAPATQAELENFFEHLERELEAGGFFLVDEKTPSMKRTIRNMFSRSNLTWQEVRTLHGIVKTIAGRPKPTAAGDSSDEPK